MELLRRLLCSAGSLRCGGTKAGKEFRGLHGAAAGGAGRAGKCLVLPNSCSPSLCTGPAEPTAEFQVHEGEIFQAETADVKRAQGSCWRPRALKEPSLAQEVEGKRWTFSFPAPNRAGLCFLFKQDLVCKPERPWGVFCAGGVKPCQLLRLVF